MTKVCPCCGHPVPSHDVFRELSPMQQRMLSILQKAGRAGMPPARLTEMIYAHDEDGGPDFASNTICVQRCRMTPILAKHGLKVSYTRGKGSVWRLEAL